MSQDTTYNGWSSYATWRVNLEICDAYCGSLMEDIEGGYLDRFDDVGALADTLEEYVTEAICGEDHHAKQLVTQYAMAFIDGVNWDEIARHWEEELVAQEPTECFECGAPLDASHDSDQDGDRCSTCAQN